jgi:hypothetical protein
MGIKASMLFVIISSKGNGREKYHEKQNNTYGADARRL